MILIKLLVAQSSGKSQNDYKFSNYRFLEKI